MCACMRVEKRVKKEKGVSKKQGVEVEEAIQSCSACRNMLTCFFINIPAIFYLHIFSRFNGTCFFIIKKAGLTQQIFNVFLFFA